MLVSSSGAQVRLGKRKKSYHDACKKPPLLYKRFVKVRTNINTEYNNFAGDFYCYHNLYVFIYMKEKYYVFIGDWRRQQCSSEIHEHSTANDSHCVSFDMTTGNFNSALNTCIQLLCALCIIARELTFVSKF